VNGTVSDSRTCKLDEQYYQPPQAKVVRFGFDTDGPTEVRIGYTELICNDFGLLDS
jgi:hypothetical protein